MSEPMRLRSAICILSILLLIALALGAPNEVTGRVVQVTDGDTFDVKVLEHDGRISEDTIRVRLADLDAPELYGERACEEGEWAREYTHSWLMGNIVSLDIDDLNGQDEYGRWIAVCYLEDGKNFNNMLVESGNAARKDFRSNEFDPFSWRDIEVKSAAETESSNDIEFDPSPDTGLNKASKTAPRVDPDALPEAGPKMDEEDSSPGADYGLWGVLAELIKMILQPSVAP